jgi:hypothetical protein
MTSEPLSSATAGILPAACAAWIDRYGTGHDVSLRRMEQEGIALTTTASVIAELAGGYPAYSRIAHLAGRRS